MLYGILAAVHLLVSLVLILVVLLQTGKGADLAGAFGGGGSQTAFGSRGAATVLSKLTTTAAVLFMVTSFSLAILSFSPARIAALSGLTLPPRFTRAYGSFCRSRPGFFMAAVSALTTQRFWPVRRRSTAFW